MEPTLNRYELEERAQWLEANFLREIETIHRTLDNLKRTVDQALTYIAYEDNGPMGPRTHADAASSIVNDAAFTLANLGLPRLINDAADLSHVKLSLVAIADRDAQLDPELATAIHVLELKKFSAERDADEAQAAKRRAKISALCEVQVPIGGRSPGFRQCGNAGISRADHNGRRVCHHHHARETQNAVHLSFGKAAS